MRPYYFFYQHCLQKLLFLILHWECVAGWLWALHKQEQTKQLFFDLLIRERVGTA
jgi:hypothetical protein